jgi:hypothetical protein
MKEGADKRRFIRLKITMALTMLVLAFTTAFANPPPKLIGKRFVGFLAATSLMQIPGLGTVLCSLKPIKSIKKTEERAPPAYVALLGFLFLCTLFFGWMLYFKPDIFAPGAGAMAHAVRIDEEGDAMHEMVEFTARLQGACVCAFLVPTMETIVDPTIHNVRKFCQLAAIVCALHTFGFIFGVFDTTRHAIKNMYIFQTDVEVVVTGLLAKGAFLDPAGKGDKVGKVAATAKKTT